MNHRIGYLTALALVGGGILGCTQGTGETSSDRTASSVEMHWMSAGAVSDACHQMGVVGHDSLNGCARSKPGNAAVCEIYAVEPKNFEDSNALKVLGHELWHCMGAKHPES